jgi:hypothetical protein
MSKIEHKYFVGESAAHVESAVSDFPESLDTGAPSKRFEWIDAIRNDVVRLPLFSLAITDEGRCLVRYSISTFKRSVVTRIDLSFFNSNGFLLLKDLSLDPQHYDGPGSWDNQIKHKDWREVRYDFHKIHFVHPALYVEHSFA